MCGSEFQKFRVNFKRHNTTGIYQTMRGILPRRISFSTIPFTRKARRGPDNIIPFHKLAQSYLTYLEEEIFKPLLPLNESMNIKRIPNELILETGQKGKFKFQVDILKENLVLSSPQSGVIFYYFSPETQQWLSVKDDHDLRGLVTRDWLRSHGGCPLFD
jgi:frataxin-like iron-binding protein CyaY